MATPLDLQEQEQLDTLKAFWKQYGNLVTWLLILVLGAYAGWNGWQYMQRDRAGKAAVLFDELDRAAQAGDVERSSRAFSDLKDRYPKTAFAEQGALTAARVQFEKGQTDAARASLSWAAANAVQDEVRSVARLRLAGIQFDAKQYDDALKTLEGPAAGFEALIADRRGDIYVAQGKTAEARTAYRSAWDAMEATMEYRRIVEAKLTALGAAPEASPAGAASAGAAK